MGTTFVQTNRKSLSTIDTTCRTQRSIDNEKNNAGISAYCSWSIIVRTCTSSSLVCRFFSHCIYIYIHMHSYYRYQTLPDIMSLLSSPILIRHSITRQLDINYDPLIDVYLHDCELLVQHSISMSDLAYQLLLNRHRIRLLYERLKVSAYPSMY
jgi:hypothetical protein